MAAVTGTVADGNTVNIDEDEHKHFAAGIWDGYTIDIVAGVARTGSLGHRILPSIQVIGDASPQAFTSAPCKL